MRTFYTCLEVYLLCLVLPVRDILKKLRHVFMFLSSPEEDGMYGYSMWSFLLLCVLWRCSVTGHFYSITPTQKYGEEHERKAVISSCLDYNKGKRRTDRRHRFMLQSILSISCNLILCSVLSLINLKLQINDQSYKAGYFRWFYNRFASPQWHKASKNYRLILSFPSSINWIYQHVIKCATKMANFKMLKGL